MSFVADLAAIGSYVGAVFFSLWMLKQLLSSGN